MRALLIVLVVGSFFTMASPPETGAEEPPPATRPDATAIDPFAAPFGVGLATVIEDLGRIPLPAPFERVPLAGAPAGAPLLMLPVDTQGSAVPSDRPFPWPADDLDGDGREETYLVEFPERAPREETRLVSLSGLDGSTKVFHSAADWIAPPVMVRTGLGALQVAHVNEERVVIQEDGWEIWAWSGHLMVRDPLGDEVLWEVPYEAQVDEDGGGQLTWSVLAPTGAFLDPSGQGVFAHFTYHWDAGAFFSGELAPGAVEMVDLWSGQPRYTFAEGAGPFAGAILGSGAPVLYGPSDLSSVRLTSATDGTVLHTIDVGFPVRAFREIVVDAEPALLVHSPEEARVTQIAVLRPDGTVLWNEPKPVSQFLYATGTRAGDSIVAFAQIYADCVAETITFTQGSFLPAEARIAWQSNHTMHWAPDLLAGLTLSSGDLDGDGVGDPSFSVFRFGYEAVVEEHDLCEGRGSWLLLVDEDPEGNMTVFSGVDGKRILRVERGDLPGGTILGTNDPTARVRTIPIFEQRVSSVWALGWQELRVHAWDFANETIVGSAFVDAHAGVSDQRSWRVLPLDFFSGPVDRFYVYWSSRTALPEDASYARYTVSFHDAHTAAELWRHGSGRPFDVPIPEEVVPLPPTPFE